MRVRSIAVLDLPLRSCLYGKTHWPEMQGPLDELRVNHAERWVHLVVLLWWLVVLLWCVVVLRFCDDCWVSNSGPSPSPMGVFCSDVLCFDRFAEWVRL